MVSVNIGDAKPLVRVVRFSFFPLPGGGSRHLRWVESAPVEESDHDEICGCARDARERPDGDPFDVRQEVRLSWPECSIAVENGISEPWVTFRRAGDVDRWRRRRAHGARDDEDRDHAYFIFDGRQKSAKIEVASGQIPLTGVLLTNLLVGNEIDTGKLLDGLRPSEAVNLADVASDQVWIHAAPWLDAMRTISSAEEAAVLRKAVDLARSVRATALPYAMALDVSVEAVKARTEHDPSLIQAAVGLRRSLAPFAFEVEHTELFRRAREMYTQEMQQARRPSSTVPERHRVTPTKYR